MRDIDEHERMLVAGGRRLGEMSGAWAPALNVKGVIATLSQRLAGQRNAAPEPGNKGYYPYDRFGLPRSE